jgi:hemolysin activation/secretion protein
VKALLCFIVIALPATATEILVAQTYEQIAPNTPEPYSQPVLSQTAPAKIAHDEDTVIVPTLNGLVFFTHRTDLNPQGLSIKGLQIDGLPLLATDEFRSMTQAYLGHPLSMRSLNQLAREVVLYFNRHDRPVVDVLVPEQNIQTGTVQFLVVEGLLGCVRTEGNRWFSSNQIRDEIRIMPGDSIDSQVLIKDLAWLNQNPFRQTDVVFARGEKPGTTDIILRTKDRFPLRSFAGYEDSGNALTGFDRVLFGLNWGNAFGLDHQLNYQFTSSPSAKHMAAHSGSYVIPLNTWRHTLTFYGSYAESQPELPGGYFTLKGRTWQASMRYRAPLAPQHGYTHAFTAGLDFKRSNNNLAFGGIAVFDQFNDVAQAVLAYNSTLEDQRGITTGEITLAVSPGGLDQGNHTKVFRQSRALARADYTYARLIVERMAKLPAGFALKIRGTGQMTTTNLLGSEQLGLGGAESLRGYEEREGNGDNGIILSTELHAPAVHFAQYLVKEAGADRLDPLIFWDYGIATSCKRLPGEIERIEMSSVGAGFRYTFSTNLSVRANYGWQLKNSGVSDGRRSSRAHVSVLLAY